MADLWKLSGNSVGSIRGAIEEVVFGIFFKWQVAKTIEQVSDTWELSGNTLRSFGGAIEQAIS